MSELSIAPYITEHFDDWNTFVKHSNEGTIFHRLDFLMYHGERFRQQEHHLMWYKGQTLFGVMPMAIFEEDGKRIVRSPYGASYGGPIFKKPLSYTDSQEIVTSLINYMLQLDVSFCRLTLPIMCCYEKYSETFRLALLEHGFYCANREISSVVSLASKKHISEEMTSRARNMARKACNVGVVIVQKGDIHDFWMVMERTFEKHGTHPTHSFVEFQWLCERLPENIYVDVAYLSDLPIAGIGYFGINQRVNSSFYLCQDPEFQSTQAQSMLIYDALSNSQQSGFQWFDFGTSSVNMRGRENIFRFKESFNAIGLFRDTYVWEKE